MGSINRQRAGCSKGTLRTDESLAEREGHNVDQGRAPVAHLFFCLERIVIDEVPALNLDLCKVTVEPTGEDN